MALCDGCRLVWSWSGVAEPYAPPFGSSSSHRVSGSLRRQKQKSGPNLRHFVRYVAPGPCYWPLKCLSGGMARKIRPDWEQEAIADPICPLCLRPIPTDALQTLHNLVPKTRGGRVSDAVLMHEICHNEIHAALTDSELAREYNTTDALRAHPRLAKFVAWVAKRPADFHAHTETKGRFKR
jgi:hypothetical protein